MKINSVGAELFHVDGDDEANNGFSHLGKHS